jgi:hypothetical protein
MMTSPCRFFNSSRQIEMNFARKLPPALMDGFFFSSFTLFDTSHPLLTRSVPPHYSAHDIWLLAAYYTHFYLLLFFLFF